MVESLDVFVITTRIVTKEVVEEHSESKGALPIEEPESEDASVEAQELLVPRQETLSNRQFQILISPSVNTLARLHWTLKKQMNLSPDMANTLSVLDHIYTTLSADKDSPARVSAVYCDNEASIKTSEKASWSQIWAMRLDEVLMVNFPPIRIQLSDISSKEDQIQISIAAGLPYLV